jgi:hypothetical protein
VHLKNLKISLLKMLAKIAIAAAIPTPIAMATFHNTHGSFFFKRKKFTSKTTLCLTSHVKIFFLKLKKKRSHRCWLWMLPWLWGQVATFAVAIVARAFNSGDPNYVYPSCKVNA